MLNQIAHDAKIALAERDITLDVFFMVPEAAVPSSRSVRMPIRQTISGIRLAKSFRLSCDARLAWSDHGADPSCARRRIQLWFPKNPRNSGGSQSHIFRHQSTDHQASDRASLTAALAQAICTVIRPPVGSS